MLHANKYYYYCACACNRINNIYKEVTTRIM
jgi:hypothetical protein